jgi:hypothetical protein
MKMKSKLFFLLLICYNITCFGQLKPSMVVLKSGDTLNGVIGKLKNETFKYKKYSNGKSKEINFSEINIIQIRYSKNDTKTYRFFQLNSNNKFLAVQPSILGTKTELFFTTYNINSSGAGGININQTIVQYYAKKKRETKLTYLGKYDIFGAMREKVIEYFSDCRNLVEKVKNKDFRMRNGLEKVVEYYNKNCE